MTETMMAKIAGLIGGTALALLFDPPRSRSGAIRRTIAALIFGYIFGHFALYYMSWEVTNENIGASWAIAAFSSWTIMGLAKRVTEKVIETRAKAD